MEPFSNSTVNGDERVELLGLQKKLKRSVWRKNFKKGQSLFSQKNEVKSRYLRACRAKYPIKLLCNVL